MHKKWQSLSKRVLIGFLNVFVVLIISLVLAEFVLRITNPLGAYSYFHDAVDIINSFVDSPRGRVNQAGDYALMGWSFRILPDNTRFVPATDTDALCKVIVAGDSVTFGQGVDDDDTWVNQLASALPQYEFVNSGAIGRNVEDARMAIETIEGDAYIYLIIYNDADERGTVGQKLNRYYWALEVYLSLFFGKKNVERDIPMFREEINQISSRDDTLIFVFENDELRHEANTAIEIPMYTAQNSAFDSHPNAQGHQEIAAAILPYASSFLEVQCNQE